MYVPFLMCIFHCEGIELEAIMQSGVCVWFFWSSCQFHSMSADWNA